MTQETIVLGGGPTGLEIATELAAQDGTVSVVAEETTANRAREAGLMAHESTLESATPAVDCSAATVVVATPSDARNLLLATAAPRVFDAERVVALVNDPDRHIAFDDAGIETVCVSQAVARAATDSLAVTESTPANRVAETDEHVRLRE